MFPGLIGGHPYRPSLTNQYLIHEPSLPILKFDDDFKHIPDVIIMCGPPASGKSTFIKNFIPPTFRVLSRDQIREFFFGAKYKPNKKSEDKVTAFYNQYRDEVIKQKRSVVVDKTNCDEARFLEEIKIFEDNGYTISIKFFDVSLPLLIFRELKRRLTNRSKPQVPFKVIKNMKKRYDRIPKHKYDKYQLL